MYYVFAALFICAAIAAIVDAAGTVSPQPARNMEFDTVLAFNDEGELLRPSGFRRWVFVGSPLTPDSLNGGAAIFPEFHNIYVETSAYDRFVDDGHWPSGTVIAREFQLALPGDRRDGSRMEASGRGYFPGALNGLDVAIKDPRRFPDTNGWGYFNFGRHAPPYAETAAEASVAACAGCHIANAHDDMVFSDFYFQLGTSELARTRAASTGNPTPQSGNQPPLVDAALCRPWPNGCGRLFLSGTDAVQQRAFPGERRVDGPDSRTGIGRYSLTLDVLDVPAQCPVFGPATGISCLHGLSPE